MDLGTKEFNNSAMEMFGGKPKQQTAMQELIDFIESQEYNFLNKEQLESCNKIKEKAEQLLEMEKQQGYSEEEVLAFGKSCFYKGFDKAENDDANCYTSFREEIGGLFEQFKNK